MDRRQFLAATLALELDPPAERGRSRRIGAYLTPGTRATRVMAVREAHGIRVHAVPTEEAPPAGALAVHLYRYDGAPRTDRRLVLAWTRIGGGLYFRSSIPYALRQDLRPGQGLQLTVVLAEPGPIAVYQESFPDRPTLGQVVIAVGRLRVLE
jgi:hypothetical protein